MDDGRLGELLRLRDVRDSGIKDFFDLADRLLDRSSLQSALSRLDRHCLIALRQLGTGTATGIDPGELAQLDELALVTGETPYDAVTEVLEALPAGALDEPEPPALEPVSHVDQRFTDAAAAEGAFSTTFAVREIVEELRRSPARELARGGIALPDSKRLAAAAEIALDELAALIAVAASAGLVSLQGGLWLPTEAASEWQQKTTVDRWVALARSWIGALPDDLHSLLAQRRHAMWGEHLANWVRWRYPASGEWMNERIAEQTTRAALLGITAGGAPSAAGTHLLAGEADLAAASMAPLFPQEVDKVYLQHDLSIVSPGPLAAPLDSKLRQLADVESSGLATTYRVSAESLNRAIYAGASADSLRAFLGEISLTGIPQPLDYLIAETVRRHALVRVGRAGSGSYVRSDDGDLLSAIRVDQRLSSLGLYAVGGRLESRLSESVVFWALSDARYPVAAENEQHTIVAIERQYSNSPGPVPRDQAREIVERLRATAGADESTGAAWIERQLDLAIKARIAVVVEVLMPGGAKSHYLLEPTGLGGGRLRARDRKADIERTLPLTSIVEVREPE